VLGNRIVNTRRHGVLTQRRPNRSGMYGFRILSEQDRELLYAKTAKPGARRPVPDAVEGQWPSVSQSARARCGPRGHFRCQGDPEPWEDDIGAPYEHPVSADYTVGVMKPSMTKTRLDGLAPCRTLMGPTIVDARESCHQN
jgi:hypothetical protein